MGLTKSGYRKRIIDNQIENNLQAFGAVCINGPKWCGKTWAALNQANNRIIAVETENWMNPAMVI